MNDQAWARETPPTITELTARHEAAVRAYVAAQHRARQARTAAEAASEAELTAACAVTVTHTALTRAIEADEAERLACL